MPSAMLAAFKNFFKSNASETNKRLWYIEKVNKMRAEQDGSFELLWKETVSDPSKENEQYRAWFLEQFHYCKHEPGDLTNDQLLIQETVREIHSIRWRLTGYELNQLNKSKKKVEDALNKPLNKPEVLRALSRLGYKEQWKGIRSAFQSHKLEEYYKVHKTFIESPSTQEKLNSLIAKIDKISASFDKLNTIQEIDDFYDKQCEALEELVDSPEMERIWFYCGGRNKPRRPDVENAYNQKLDELYDNARERRRMLRPRVQGQPQDQQQAITDLQKASQQIQQYIQKINGIVVDFSKQRSTVEIDAEEQRLNQDIKGISEEEAITQALGQVKGMIVLFQGVVSNRETSIRIEAQIARHRVNAEEAQELLHAGTFPDVFYEMLESCETLRKKAEETRASKDQHAFTVAEQLCKTIQAAGRKLLHIPPQSYAYTVEPNLMNKMKVFQKSCQTAIQEARGVLNNGSLNRLWRALEMLFDLVTFFTLKRYCSRFSVLAGCNEQLKNLDKRVRDIKLPQADGGVNSVPVPVAP